MGPKRHSEAVRNVSVNFFEKNALDLRSKAFGLNSSNYELVTYNCAKGAILSFQLKVHSRKRWKLDVQAPFAVLPWNVLRPDFAEVSDV